MTTDSRIESLETQVRTLKRMLFGVFGLVVVGGLLAAASMQSVPDVIQAKSFQVVNDEGTVVVGIGMSPTTGCGVLSLYDKEHKQLVAMGGTDDESTGGIIGVVNNGHMAVTLIAENGNTGRIVLSENEKPLSSLFVKKGMGARLEMFNKDGKPVTGLGADVDGNGNITTLNAKGEVTFETP